MQISFLLLRKCLLGHWILPASPGFQMTLSSVSLSSALVCRAPQFIVFTSRDTQHVTKSTFLDGHGFPGVLAVIDCKHILWRVTLIHGHIYRNCKRFHSINIQVICGANCMVAHVFANYPGSTHDLFVLVNSGVPAAFQGIVPLVSGC